MENFVPQLIRVFGWSMLNSLWQSALIYGILFIVLFSLPKLASKYRHNLSFCSIVLMLICFGYNMIHQIIQISLKQTAELNFNSTKVDQLLNNGAQSFSQRIESYFPIVVLFYVIGIILQIFIIAKGYNRLSELKKQSLSEIPENWQNVFTQVLSKLNFHKKIEFKLSGLVNVPLVVGYLKPVVLFPISLINGLSNEQVEAILIHELSHIRRNDFLLNFIKTLIETLLFFNPFVWMAGRFITIEREHACDDLVLKIMGKPLNYAQALLKLELLKDKTAPIYALAATGKSQNLYQRIKRITNMKTNYLNVKQQMAALTLGIACLFCIAWVNPISSKKENKKLSKPIMVSTKNVFENIKPFIFSDTLKKRKFKVVTINQNGEKTEYSSLKEMPDSLKRDFINDQSFAFNAKINFDSLKLNFKMDTLVFASIKEHFKSPEWRKQQEDIRRQANEIRKQFNSPEWKKQQEEIIKQSEEIRKQFNSPEWKKQQEDIIKQSEEIKKQFNSAEWKKQVQEIKKQFKKVEFNSPELKLKNKDNKLQNSLDDQQLKEKFDKDVQELKRKNIKG